ncbi:[Myosin light-chain] kinase protein [Dioscorea alata]|uniref:[Myosin light-chain] kinase protein n=1 Tax=Dioscorea alata TaxID=55571 RepID=A0ACB7W2F4_DIOAL|nr:[Myosin light-chain] kinase protein [Dioscorea alata]
MHGGRNRKDDLPKINNTNIFAALETLKKKKKSDKDQGKSKASSKSLVKEPEPPVFWAPAPVTKKWADVEDEDDDDYFETTAPPSNVWGTSEPRQTKDTAIVAEEESESEDEIDEIDDDVEDEPEHEPEVPAPAEPVVKKPAPSIVPKDAERQLSKKELKKKELAELDAVLAELGISGKDNNSETDGTNGVADKKTGEQHGEKNDNNVPAPLDSKTSKKKKSKKDKSAKEIRDLEEQLNGMDANTPGEGSGTEPTEGDASGAEVKDKIKKMASVKKKKTNKELDAAAKAAQLEAAARSKRLAAAKKKEKSHYNQQPVR